MDAKTLDLGCDRNNAVSTRKSSVIVSKFHRKHGALLVLNAVGVRWFGRSVWSLAPRAFYGRRGSAQEFRKGNNT